MKLTLRATMKQKPTLRVTLKKTAKAPLNPNRVAKMTRISAGKAFAKG